VSPPAGEPARPLLLLDVDGVVNVPGSSSEAHAIELPSLAVVVTFPDGLRRRLAALDRAYEVAWLTSWGRWAPEHLGPLLGMNWPSAWEPEPGETQDAKVEVARRWAGDQRALAWVDDLWFEEAELWLRSRPGPSLVPNVDPAVGLDDGLLAHLLDFARTGGR
jgi:hypothetical protein